MPTLCGQVVISEFLAVNSGGLADEDGDSSDWIELYNSGPQTVNLAGWHLTDDAADLTKWAFPGVSINSGQYLVVFASDKNRAPLPPGKLHTNFKLGSDGEYLGLVQSNGTTIEWEYPPAFPPQSQNVSYGINPSSQMAEYYTTPTPGAPNSAGLTNVLGPVAVSPQRGFYDAPFAVSLSCTNPGATIRYTLDGSAPTASSGTIYFGPISVNATVVLRVLAYRSGSLSQPVVTHTYIFPAQVVNQTSTPPGYPATWTSQVTAWYGMYPGYPDSDETLRQALLTLPTVCIAGTINDIFGSSTGYYNHGGKGNNAGWQKPGSIELIHPDGDEGFQINAGIQGRADNVTATRKRGVKVEFKSLYGPSKLRYPGLFDDAKEGREAAAEEFDALILRPGKAENYTGVGYNPVLNIYFRDIMARDVEIATTGYGSRNLFVHLYINGIYWGVYNLTEVYDSDYYADYFGGAEEDWFEVRTKDSSQRDGKDGLYDHSDVVGTNRYLSFLNFMDTADLSQYTNYLRAAQDIHPLHFAEYIIYYSYYGIGDWPDNNWIFAMRNGPEPLPGVFLSWDAEKTWFENDDPQSYKHAWYSPYLQSENNPEGPDYHPVINRIWEGLIQNEEFRMLFADRSYELMHNNGLLTDSNRIERFMYYVDLLNQPIRIDQKRWSADNRRSRQPGVLFTYANVQTEINRVLNNTVNNVGKYIAAFRAKNLYPGIDPPQISITATNPGGFTYTVTVTTGDQVYYTTDGSDPRLVGGGVAPGAQSFSPTAGGQPTLVSFGSAGWRYMVTSFGLGDSAIVVGHPSYGTGNWKHPDYSDTLQAGTADNQWHQGTAPLGYGVIGDSGNPLPLATVIGYGGDAGNKYPTTYFRQAFDVVGAASYTNLTLDLILEDGGIVYLNGREIARSTGFNAGNVSYGTYSTRSQSGAAERAVETFVVGLAPGHLVDGRNVIAVEVHNDDPNSSDLAMELGLTAHGPTSVGNAVNVLLPGSSIVKARSWKNGEWSALNKLARSHPDDRNIILSEIMYNPPMLGGVDGDAFEFVELRNVGSKPVNLRGMRFTRGITFAFEADHVLASGAYAVLVSDATRFAMKYPGVPIAGIYTNGLLANDGETVELEDVAGEVVFRVGYNDKAPWPELADNGGYSLVPIREEALFDAAEAGLWRASTLRGGSPGTNDPAPILADVLISEILTHTDPPLTDSIELVNAGAQPVDVSGWSLTDDVAVPGKFVFPPSTPPIAAGGRLVVDENDFNSTPGVPPSFALSSLGESVGLFAPDGSGGWRLVHEVNFEAAENGVSFGLHTISTGGLRYPAQTSLTLGTANIGPRIGPVVINEMMYHPLFPGGTEYIELFNNSGQSVPLYDPVNPAHTWRISGAGFQFPSNIVLGSDEFLLVVDTNPAQFRANNGIPSSVQVFGPMGRLSKTGERLALQKPDAPEIDPNTGLLSVPYITVDEVDYRDALPWPPEADGTGDSLSRMSPFVYGDDPLHWVAAPPTPGGVNLVDTDLDGIPDDVERRYGLDPNNGADGLLDLDGDGLTAVEEWLSGTDWNDGGDVLRLGIVDAPALGVRLSFEGKPGWRYILQRSGQPAGVAWDSIRVIHPVRVGTVAVVETQAATNASYYRLLVQPPW